MVDPQYLITLYLTGGESLTQAQLDFLSEWIEQSDENAASFVRRSFIHRAIHDSLAGEDIKKKALMDLSDVGDSGLKMVMGGSVALNGVDITNEALSDKKENTPNGNQDRDSLVGFMQDMAEYEKTAPMVEIPEEDSQRELIQKVVYPPREKRKISKFSLFAFVTSAAAMFFLVLFVKFAPVETANHDLPHQAVIVDSVNAKWAGEQEPAGIGDYLASEDGDCWLQSGFVKLLFGNGAEVVIESPSRFEILSGDELNVLSGRAYSKVPQRAIGFKVYTPNSTIVDLGTEFGVEVLDGSSSLHMIKGKASVLPNSLRTQKPIELTAGNAKAIDRDGILQDVRVDDQKFVADISSKMGMIYRGGKAIGVGAWESRLTSDLEKDLRTDGRLIQAVNLGGSPVQVSTLAGIRFSSTADDRVILRGGQEARPDDLYYNGSDENLSALLNTSVLLKRYKKDTPEDINLRLMLEDLKEGQTYRIQFIVGFKWQWCQLESYGIENEYFYFANNADSEFQVGIQTYTWKAGTVNRIRIRAATENWINVFGYVVHEVNQDDHDENL